MPYATPNFYYLPIGDALVQSLCEHIERGESFVLLGPRGAGKRYVINLLNAALEIQNRALLVAAFGKHSITADEVEAVKVLAAACGIAESLNSLGEWSEAILRRSSSEAPIRLAATNVDGLSKALASAFLTHVRTLTQERRLIVAITGESNLIDLVHGPNSAFNCVHQYVVQSLDRRHFGKLLAKWMRGSISLGQKGPARPNGCSTAFMRLPAAMSR